MTERPSIRPPIPPADILRLRDQYDQMVRTGGAQVGVPVARCDGGLIPFVTVSRDRVDVSLSLLAVQLMRGRSIELSSSNAFFVYLAMADGNGKDFFEFWDWVIDDWNSRGVDGRFEIEYIEPSGAVPVVRIRFV